PPCLMRAPVYSGVPLPMPMRSIIIASSLASASTQTAVRVFRCMTLAAARFATGSVDLQGCAPLGATDTGPEVARRNEHHSRRRKARQPEGVTLPAGFCYHAPP